MAGMPFPDFSKMLEQFRQFQIPGFDVNGLLEARRRDFAALTQLNQTAYEGLQQLAQNQAETIRDAIANWQAAASVMNAPNPTEAQARQSALVQRAVETALDHMREFAQNASTSQAKAVEVVTTRTQESLEELRRMLQQPEMQGRGGGMGGMGNAGNQPNMQ